MILADKIINLRKKSGMSQEDLASRLNVSRQSVSKWEGSLSIPDLDKILLLSNIFGVSTDVLLKDELELEDGAIVCDEESSKLVRVTMDEAQEFLNLKRRTSIYITIGVALCILSPVLLIVLGGVSEYLSGINENLACAIGVITLLLMVTVGVILFLISGNITKKYEFLNTEIFETEYGVSSMVSEKKNMFDKIYFRFNLIGIVLCVISPIPLFIALFLENEVYCVYSVGMLIMIVSLATALFVYVGNIKGSYDRLLEENDYSREKKKKNPIIECLSTSYWLVATSIYLIWSFISNAWELTWIVWVIAGVLYGAIFGIINVVLKNVKK